MFKDYVIVDDVFDEPKTLISIAYRSNILYSNNYFPLNGALTRPDDADKPKGFWKGYRSQSLHLINKDIFTDVSRTIIRKAFNIPNFNFVLKCHLHVGTANCEVTDSDFHTDTTLFAGVVYLNENPELNSGTIIKTNDSSTTIENKFNRLVFYKSSVSHRPENFFGNTLTNSRLTLNIFIDGIGFHY